MRKVKVKRIKETYTLKDVLSKKDINRLTEMIYDIVDKTLGLQYSADIDDNLEYALIAAIHFSISSFKLSKIKKKNNKLDIELKTDYVDATLKVDVKKAAMKVIENFIDEWNK